MQILILFEIDYLYREGGCSARRGGAVVDLPVLALKATGARVTAALNKIASMWVPLVDQPACPWHNVEITQKLTSIL